MTKLAGRISRSVTRSGLNKKVFFLHLPKCGGTSVSEAMQGVVGFGERIGNVDALSTRRAAGLKHFGKDCCWICHDDQENGHLTFALRENIALNYMGLECVLIQGHIQLKRGFWTAVQRRYAPVTLLREPTERMISNYRMARRAGITKASLSDYLYTPLARAHATVFLRYLSGENAIHEQRAMTARKLALQRLDEFALVGVLEELEQFKQAFNDMFGVRLHIAHRNAARRAHPDISSDDLKLMNEMLTHDRAIYEHVCAKHVT